MEQESKWIVLIQRTPKGPFSLRDIELLLSKKIITRSDYAYKVPPKGAKSSAGWKILGQFEEFDRRGPNKPASENVPVPERRQIGPNDNEPKANLVPEELSGISPEELVLRSRKEMPAADSVSDHADNKTEKLDEPASAGGKRKIWLLGFGIAALLSYVLFKPQAREPKQTVNRVISSQPADNKPKVRMQLPLEGTQPRKSAAFTPQAVVPPPREEHSKPRARSEPGEIPPPDVAKDEEDADDSEDSDESELTLPLKKKKIAKKKAKAQPEET
ncbi:MAG: hypothetical protein HY537_10735 [Deltaproteobacteria bacterium]|nr:hypothetical protein [Deltaproteobacteria bacterium]